MTQERLTQVWESEDAKNTGGVAWVDFNHDGYPELLVGNADDVLQIYRNMADYLVLAWESPIKLVRAKLASCG